MTNFNWDSITELLGDRSRLPPSDSVTIVQFAEKQKVSRSSAAAMVTRLVSSGHLQCGIFWDKANSRWTKYYWLPAKKGKR